jgi:Ca2+-binding EF-hand superfamily protein
MGQDGKANGTISQSDFEAVLAAFGGGKDYADQIFDSLDKDHDGSVSNAEWLHAVGSTASEPGSDTSQSLLKAMDSDGNGIVNSAEFTRFEAAMIAAEKTV